MNGPEQIIQPHQNESQMSFGKYFNREAFLLRIQWEFKSVLLMFKIDLIDSGADLTKVERDREHMSGRVKESKCIGREPVYLYLALT